MGRIYSDVIIGGKLVIYDPVTEKDYELDSTALAGVISPATQGNATFYRDIIRTKNLVIGNNESGKKLDLAALIAGTLATEYEVPEDGAVFYRDTVIAGKLRIGDRDSDDEFDVDALVAGSLAVDYPESDPVPEPVAILSGSAAWNVDELVVTLTYEDDIMAEAAGVTLSQFGLAHVTGGAGSTTATGIANHTDGNKVDIVFNAYPDVDAADADRELSYAEGTNAMEDALGDPVKTPDSVLVAIPNKPA